MKKNLLLFAGKFTAIALITQMAILSAANAQQVLQKSYASDDFNTDGTAIIVSGSSTPADAPRVTVTKMKDDGYLEVDYDDLNGGTTDDFIKLTFSTPLDLSSLTTRRVRIVYSADQLITTRMVLSNVPWGPYTNDQFNGSGYLQDTGGDSATLDVKFTLNDGTQGTFDNTSVSNVYIVLNPTYNPPGYTTGDFLLASTIKIYKIIIGNNPVAGTQSAQNTSNASVYYNAENKTIQYSNLASNNAEIVVYDALGKMVNNKSLNTSSGEITVNGLTTGLYHVQLVENDAKKSFKILVQ